MIEFRKNMHQKMCESYSFSFVIFLKIWDAEHS